MARLLALLLTAWFAVMPSSVSAQNSARENRSQVDHLNAFAAELLQVIEHWQSTGRLKISERPGGYAGMPDLFVEKEYRDGADDRLLGRVRWLREQPDQAQMIEVFVYGDRGRLIVDYYVSYLVGHRNAPMYALVNLHQSDDSLQAFRQYDVFGEKLFENCRGDYFGKPVDFSINEIDTSISIDQVEEDLYVSCFGFLPSSPGDYLHPAALVSGANATPTEKPEAGDHDRMEARIAELSRKIVARPDDGALYLERGKAYLLLQQMEDAVDDFTSALAMDDSLDSGYFGRGMALGRLGRLAEGIADLTIFLERNPESSIGYTKRGVRHIWNNDFERAIKDLNRAIVLDDSNAEAHDDLGVALAQTGKLAESVSHFVRAGAIDPSYQKAYHNLAMVYYMSGDPGRALSAVNDALRLAPDTKNTLLLKASILKAMGRDAEARSIQGKAEFLSDGNWSERSAVQ
jgi:tetratricopeptide (TPR) repeat protein